MKISKFNNSLHLTATFHHLKFQISVDFGEVFNNSFHLSRGLQFFVQVRQVLLLLIDGVRSDYQIGFEDFNCREELHEAER